MRWVEETMSNDKIEGGLWGMKSIMWVILIVITTLLLSYSFSIVNNYAQYTPIYMDDIVSISPPDVYPEFILLFWIFIYIIFIAALVLLVWCEGYKEGHLRSK